MPLFGASNPPDVEKLEKKRDVKGLVKALGYDDDWLVRLAAAHALVNVGDARAVEPLLAALEAEEASVRGVSARALGNLGDDHAVEPLAATLKDEYPHVRCEAAEALGKLGDDRGVPQLVVELGQPGSEVRSSAAAALQALGWQPSSASERALHAVATEQWGAALAEGEAAVGPLVVALGDENATVRERAARTLGELGNANAIEPLIAALGDSELSVRNAVAGALGEIGDIRAVAPLIAVARDESLVAKAALAKLGPAVVEPLIAELGHRHWFARVAAAERLGERGDRRAVKPLTIVLEDGYAHVRRAAAIALGRLDDARAVEPLVAVLGDPASEVRSAAADALEGLGWQPSSATERDLLAGATEPSPDEPAAATSATASQLTSNAPPDPAVAAFIEGLELYLNPELTSMVEAETGGERAETAKWVVALLEKFLHSETEAVVALGDSAIGELEAALDRYENENELIALAILGVLFRIRGTESPLQEVGEVPAATPSGSGSKQVQGVLVVSRQPVDGADALLQQILDQQTAQGHSASPEFVGLARVGDWNDQAYVYASIRAGFSAFGDADLIDRTRVFSFEAPDGNEGKYYVLFDRR